MTLRASGRRNRRQKTYRPRGRLNAGARALTGAGAQT
jgi:hypothetical protein